MSTAMPFKVYGSQLRLQVIIAIACCSPSESKDHPAIKDAPDSLVWESTPDISNGYLNFRVQFMTPRPWYIQYQHMLNQ